MPTGLYGIAFIGLELRELKSRATILLAPLFANKEAAACETLYVT